LSSLLALATARRLVTLVACLLAVALVVLLMLPADLPTARNVKAQALVWTLPAAVRVDSDMALSVINQRRLWGAPVVAGLPSAAVPVEEKPLTPPDWRLAGVFTEAGRWAVLVTTDVSSAAPLQSPAQIQNPSSSAAQIQSQTLYVGDALPGGARILAIGHDRLTLSLNGRRVTLSTYPQ
jgi:hypothetical protein